jgi:hemerythrin-like domain-containing protein
MVELYLAWRSGDEGAFAELLDVARLYADHIARHIDKENGVLFPMLEANVREVEGGKTVEDVERAPRGVAEDAGGGKEDLNPGDGMEEARRIVELSSVARYV